VQPWLHFNGPHLITYLHVPWVHLLFSEKTIRATLERYEREGRYPAASIDARLDDLDHMNRMTVRDYRATVAASGLDVVQFDVLSPRVWKQALQRMPVLRELFAGAPTIILRKPPD
jgi:hypothetical protein